MKQLINELDEWIEQQKLDTDKIEVEVKPETQTRDVSRTDRVAEPEQRRPYLSIQANHSDIQNSYEAYPAVEWSDSSEDLMDLYVDVVETLEENFPDVELDYYEEQVELHREKIQGETPE